MWGRRLLRNMFPREPVSEEEREIHTHTPKVVHYQQYTHHWYHSKVASCRRRTNFNFIDILQLYPDKTGYLIFGDVIAIRPQKNKSRQDEHLGHSTKVSLGHCYFWFGLVQQENNVFLKVRLLKKTTKWNKQYCIVSVSNMTVSNTAPPSTPSPLPSWLTQSEPLHLVWIIVGIEL